MGRYPAAHPTRENPHMARALPVFLLSLLALLGPGNGARPLRAGEEGADLDEKLLKDHGIATDGPGLLDYFRRRTPGEGDRRRLEQLVRQLGSPSYRARQQATSELV